MLVNVITSFCLFIWNFGILQIQTFAVPKKPLCICAMMLEPLPSISLEATWTNHFPEHLSSVEFSIKAALLKGLML